MGPIGCLETSVRNYRYTLCNIAGEQRYNYIAVINHDISLEVTNFSMSSVYHEALTSAELFISVYSDVLAKIVPRLVMTSAGRCLSCNCTTFVPPRLGAADFSLFHTCPLFSPGGQSYLVQRVPDLFPVDKAAGTWR